MTYPETRLSSTRRTADALLALLAAVALTACAGTTETTTEATSQSGFSNFVVIGIAGDYNTRTHFERTVVSQLRDRGASATAWHSVSGGNKPVVKDDVLAAVAEHGFDAVLAVRRLDGDVELQVTQSRTETDEEPIGGRLVNLFRSNYTDYKTPESIDLATQSLLAVELYNAESEEKVLAFDYETKRETNLGLLIDQTAEAIVRRFEREKLIAR